MNFPFWAVALLGMVIFWPVTLLVAMALVCGGWYLRGFWRWAAWGVSGGMLLVLLVAGGYYAVHPPSDSWWYKHRLKGLNGRLAAARMVEGIELPAGTYVEWADLERTEILTAKLQGMTRVAGLLVQGEIDHESLGYQGSYGVTLAEPRELDGWACGVGEATVGQEGKMEGCTLARETVWFGLRLPAGTFMGRAYQMRFVMPDDRGMAVVGTGLTVPPGGVVEAKANGTLMKAKATWKVTGRDEVPATTPLVERGAKLNTEADFYPSQGSTDEGPMVKATTMRGRLLEELHCQATTLAVGTYVEVPAEGEVRLPEGPAGVVAGCLR